MSRSAMPPSRSATASGSVTRGSYQIGSRPAAAAISTHSRATVRSTGGNASRTNGATGAGASISVLVEIRLGIRLHEVRTGYGHTNALVLKLLDESTRVRRLERLGLILEPAHRSDPVGAVRERGVADVVSEPDHPNSPET